MELEWLADLLLLPAGCGWDTQKETKLWLPMCIDRSQSFEPLYTLNRSAAAIFFSRMGRTRVSLRRKEKFYNIDQLQLLQTMFVCLLLMHLEDTAKVRPKKGTSQVGQIKISMFCSLTSSIHGQVKQSTGTPRPQT
jgi:hypothetical protein